jgi:two-component system response regulator DesR
MARPGPIRVLCVDDHSFLVEGLSARFRMERDVTLVGSLPSAEQLLAVAVETKPDVVLLDIEMPGSDAFAAAADLRRQCPEVRTIFLSAYVRDDYISAAVKAGAWGYFAKSEDAETIIQGIRKVAGGEFAFSPKVQERLRPAAGDAAAGTGPPSGGRAR